MGTSKSYKSPTTPQWSKLKREVSQASRNGSVPDPIANDVIRNFIHTIGGGGGGSSGGGGGTGGGNQAAQRAGRRLAVFSHAVSSVGLREALRDFGLGDYIGRPVVEVALALVDRLCDDGSTLDEIDARNAMSDFVDELLEDTNSFDDVEVALEKKLQGEAIGGMLLKFFGHYLYHQFCRQFFERLTARRGDDKAAVFFKNIRDFIISKFKNATFGKNLTSIDWSGKEGETIIQEIQQQTFAVFGE
jgi:hypothetical protein